MEIARWNQIKKYSSVAANITLVLFVIYTVLMWEVSLKIKYDYIIIFAFAIFSFHAFVCMKSRGLTFFGRTDSLFSFVKPIDSVMAGFLMLNALWIFAVPKLNHLPVSLAIQEAGILLMMVVYFPLAILIRMKEIHFASIKNVFLWTTFFLACWYCVIWCAELANQGTYEAFFGFLKRIAIFKVGSVYQGWSVFRIVLGNSVLLLPGLVLTVVRKKKMTPLGCVMTAVYTFAILSTFLKSLWIGLAFSMLVLFIYSLRVYRKQRLNSIIWGIAVICITVIVSNFTIFRGAVFSRALNSFTNHYFGQSATLPDESGKKDSSESAFGKMVKDSSDSNTEKLIQIKKLVSQWKQKPLSGYGYGSYIHSYQRSKTAIYAYEMTSFALLMKVGVLGIIFWFLFFFFFSRHVFRVTGNDRFHFAAWLAILIGFLISIQTNPLLITANALAMLTYLMLDTVGSEEQKQAPLLQKNKLKIQGGHLI